MLFNVISYEGAESVIGFGDFKIYYTAASLYLEGKDPYEVKNYYYWFSPEFIEIGFVYVYLPIALLFFIPFTKFQIFICCVIIYSYKFHFIGIYNNSYNKFSFSLFIPFTEGQNYKT